MNIRKYWLDAELYIYAIGDSDSETKTDYFIGRDGFGKLIHVFGLLDDENYPKDEEEFLKDLYNAGYFTNDFETEFSDLV